MPEEAKENHEDLTEAEAARLEHRKKLARAKKKHARAMDKNPFGGRMVADPLRILILSATASCAE